jgi:hypothetical protein
MTTKQQYKRAYHIVRANWKLGIGFIRFQCISENIDPEIRKLAIFSFVSRSNKDRLGRSYRSSVHRFNQIRAELTLGHY